MHLTINIAQPDTWKPTDTTPCPSQGMSASDREHTARLRQQLAPLRGCRTPIVTRALHQGEEVPKEKSLQWLVNEMLSKNALHLGNEASRDMCGDESTEGQSSSSTLTLHVECGGSGEQFCRSSPMAFSTQIECAFDRVVMLSCLEHQNEITGIHIRGDVIKLHRVITGVPCAIR